MWIIETTGTIDTAQEIEESQRLNLEELQGWVKRDQEEVTEVIGQSGVGIAGKWCRLYNSFNKFEVKGQDSG